jgi:hypothetical protein
MSKSDHAASGAGLIGFGRRRDGAVDDSPESGPNSFVFPQWQRNWHVANERYKRLETPTRIDKFLSFFLDI